MFEKYNNKKETFTFDSNHLEFISLNDYVAKFGNKQGIVRAVFNHSKDGETYACVVTDDYKIWMPSHFVSTITDILNDPEAITAINNGHCAIEPYQYEKTGKYAGTYNSVTFKDI